MNLRENLIKALTLDLPYERMERARLLWPKLSGKSHLSEAGVLILFGAKENTNKFEILFTLRTDKVDVHKGQVSFPGGRRDPGDLSLTHVALRETEEEVGIPASAIEVIGELPPLNTVTGFRVTPVIGILNTPIETLVLKLHPIEIAEIFWASLDDLRAPQCHRKEKMTWKEQEFEVHVYQIRQYRIWGATAEILKNLLERLKQ
ncbi:MAG: CoA pyrophosphatase [Deltaproteobacteria bacterium]|nr:CoA pyrophosphatase [Deltaproteobacteria bacterium]